MHIITAGMSVLAKCSNKVPENKHFILLYIQCFHKAVLLNDVQQSTQRSIKSRDIYLRLSYHKSESKIYFTNLYSVPIYIIIFSNPRTMFSYSCYRKCNVRTYQSLIWVINLACQRNGQCFGASGVTRKYPCTDLFFCVHLSCQNCILSRVFSSFCFSHILLILTDLKQDQSTKLNLQMKPEHFNTQILSPAFGFCNHNDI